MTNLTRDSVLDSMTVSSDQIVQVAQSIWESTLHLPLWEAPAGRPVWSERTMSASVQIIGPWHGIVSLNCSAGFASRAARIMFGLGEGEPKSADMRDALGELANMIGGNVKALLPEHFELSLPVVVDGRAEEISIPRARVISLIPLECEGDHLSVTVLEKDPH